ncbi:hypothetical protein [Paenibacillus sp. GCM10012306]|uniref:hypothetical protein n=1 Tax=Paenibacillus sp. GCM10012306 TaxID=3317342 RepID=UPI00360804B4
MEAISLLLSLINYFRDDREQERQINRSKFLAEIEINDLVNEIQLIIYEILSENGEIDLELSDGYPNEYDLAFKIANTLYDKGLSIVKQEYFTDLDDKLQTNLYQMVKQAQQDKMYLNTEAFENNDIEYEMDIINGAVDLTNNLRNR